MLNSVICGPINHLLKSSPWALERLRRFSESVLLIEGMPFPLRLRIESDGYFSAALPEDSPVVTIFLPEDFASRFINDRNSLFSSIRIAGAADLAEALGFVFRNLEWDVEADLASVVGDIPTRRLTRAGKTLVSNVRSSAERGMENLREYLVEESGEISGKGDLAAFCSAVNALRDDLSRLEKRINRL